MSIKSKILSVVTAHPKIVTLGIGLAITFGISIATGMIETQQAHAMNFQGSLIGNK